MGVFEEDPWLCMQEKIKVPYQDRIKTKYRKTKHCQRNKKILLLKMQEKNNDMSSVVYAIVYAESDFGMKFFVAWNSQLRQRNFLQTFLSK